MEETRDPAQPLRLTGLHYRLHIEDRSWGTLYEPLGRWVTAAARRVGKIQTGSVRTYLAYSLFTLLVLLWLVTR